MKNRILTTTLAAALLLSSVPSFAVTDNSAKQQCKAAYEQELSAAKGQRTHAERKAAKKLAKEHYKDCKHRSK